MAGVFELTAFLDKIRQSLKDWSKSTNLPFLSDPHSPNSILIALSGGADSVALLIAMREFQNDFGWDLHAAHFNHELRGEESDSDANWVEDLCETLRVKLLVEKASQCKNSDSIKSEESARSMRYKFLTRCAKEKNCSAIFFAHHQNDQVETILHHIIRGTGLRGLRGIPSRRMLDSEIELFRPMLSIRKDEILEYLESVGQNFREDSTNAFSDFTRNKLRNELIPLLKSEFNPSFEDAILGLGKRAAEVEEIIQFTVNDLLDDCILDSEVGVCKIALKSIQSKPASLIKEFFIQLWINKNWPRQKMGESEWNRLAEIAQSDSDRSIDLAGGIHIQKRGRLMVITQ